MTAILPHTTPLHPSGTSSVSYTHLDVYKRQAQRPDGIDGGLDIVLALKVEVVQGGTGFDEGFRILQRLSLIHI